MKPKSKSAMPAERSIQVTCDGKFKVGDLGVITAEWAAELRSRVYDGKRTIEQIRAERTGRILEIWTNGTWCSLRIDCRAVAPWEFPEDLEHATSPT